MPDDEELGVTDGGGRTGEGCLEGTGVTVVLSVTGSSSEVAMSGRFSWGELFAED